MQHPIHRVVSFEFASGYKLQVRFAAGTEQSLDFEPILAGELYGPLRHQDLFRRVLVDPEVHTLVWPNGADFDPATLHDWPLVADAWIARAKQWDSASVSAAE